MLPEKWQGDPTRKKARGPPPQSAATTPSVGLTTPDDEGHRTCEKRGTEKRDWDPWSDVRCRTSSGSSRHRLPEGTEGRTSTALATSEVRPVRPRTPSPFPADRGKEATRGTRGRHLTCWCPEVRGGQRAVGTTGRLRASMAPISGPRRCELGPAGQPTLPGQRKERARGAKDRGRERDKQGRKSEQGGRRARTRDDPEKETDKRRARARAESRKERNVKQKTAQATDPARLRRTARMRKPRTSTGNSCSNRPCVCPGSSPLRAATARAKGQSLGHHRGHRVPHAGALGHQRHILHPLPGALALGAKVGRLSGRVSGSSVRRPLCRHGQVFHPLGGGGMTAKSSADGTPAKAGT